MGGRHNPAVRADNCSPTAEIEERMSERDEGRDGPRGARIAGYACEFDARPARRAAPRTSSTRPAATTYIRHVPGVRLGCQDCADLQTRIPLPRRQFIPEVGTITRSAQSAITKRQMTSTQSTHRRRSGEMVTRERALSAQNGRLAIRPASSLGLYSPISVRCRSGRVGPPAADAQVAACCGTAG